MSLARYHRPTRLRCRWHGVPAGFRTSSRSGSPWPSLAILVAIAKPLIRAATAWPAVQVARFLDRLGAGFHSAPRDALIASHRGAAFGLEGIGDNLGAFLGPLITALLLIVLGVDIRWIFYLAVIPGFLPFLMVLLVRERPSVVPAKSRIDVNWRRFPKAYWIYLW